MQALKKPNTCPPKSHGKSKDFTSAAIGLVSMVLLFSPKTEQITLNMQLVNHGISVAERYKRVSVEPELRNINPIK